MQTESSQKLSFNYSSLRTYTVLSISSTDGLYVSEYFLIRKFFFADSKIPTFTRILPCEQWFLQAGRYVSSGLEKPLLAGYTYPYSNRICHSGTYPTGIRIHSGNLVTKLSMRRKAREIWQSQPGGKSKKNEKSKVDSSMDKRENLGTRFSS